MKPRFLGEILAVIVAATLVLTLAPRASATSVSPRPPDHFRVPANKSISLVGNGFGHGFGMSQYGAQGAALRGLDAAAILRFYYPKTKLVTSGGPLRVSLSGVGMGVLTVPAAPNLRIIDSGNGKAYLLPGIVKVGSPARPQLLRIQAWRLRSEGGRSVVGFLSGQTWRRWPVAIVGEGSFNAGGAPVRIAPTQRAYRGSLRLALPSGQPVNDTDLDSYTSGVVSSEMPSSWAPAALQAQAIAARSYAAYFQRSPGDWDICDDTRCQAYGGVGGESSVGNMAVGATRGKVLTYAGRPAFTQYSASNGGQRLKGTKPYLVAGADPYDGWKGNRYQPWKRSVNLSALERAHPSLGVLREIRIDKRDGLGTWGGRVHGVLLVGSKGKVRVSGDDVRRTFKLPSNWFTVATLGLRIVPVVRNSHPTVTTTMSRLRSVVGLFD